MAQLGDRVGEPVEVTFEPGDEVGWVTAAQVVCKEADFDVGIGDSDADFVLDGGGRLGVGGQPSEGADLAAGSTGLGWRLVEPLL